MDLKSPSKRDKMFDMSQVNNALDSYFSPKRKSPNARARILSPGRSPSRRATRKIAFEEPDSEEETSNAQTESTLKCDLEKLKKCFDNIDDKLPEEVIKKVDRFTDEYENWMTLTYEFNLLFHGLGSKREVLNDFEKSQLSDYASLICNGFEKDVNFRSILTTLVSEFELKIDGPKTNIKSYATEVADKLSNKVGVFYLLIHNIDGISLRDPLAQELLSVFVKGKSIRLLATVDHVNATLLWNQQVRNDFNFLYIPVSTMKACGREILAAESKLLGLDSKASAYKHSFASLETVWKASTANNRKILKHLAIHAKGLNEKNNQEMLTLSEFCSILKGDFVTESEAALRIQLVEFVDHNIVEMKDGCIKLKMDRNLLVSFLESKEEND
ncbi:origin recognition complex subunit 2 domain-containing protein [Ditylenchus destructor]|nr:origin recognition complex subunit 2 domain-containing protein [Ditylenchus destructor]